MADNEGIHSCSGALSGTTAETARLTGRGGSVTIENKHATENMWVRFDGVTAVADADEAFLVPPGFRTFPVVYVGQLLSLVGNGNTFVVETL